MFKGFTILELVIVIGTVAILMVLGIDVMLRFRSTIELQSSYANVVSAIKTLQNSSRNSLKLSSVDSTPPDIYSIFPQGGTGYLYYSCSFIDASKSTATCTPTQTPVDTPKTLSQDVGLSIGYSSDIPYPDSYCGFERRTGLIYGLVWNGTHYELQTDGSCTYTLTNSTTLETKSFSIVAGSSNINL